MRRARSASLLSLVLAASLVELPRSAEAQDPFVCIDHLDQDAIDYRLRHLEQRFLLGRRRARAYWYGWLAFGGAVATQAWTRFAFADDREDRDPLFISGVGAISLLAQVGGMAMTPAFASRRLDRMPEDTIEERRAKLREATRLLALGARRQRRKYSWTARIGPVVWAIVTGTYLAVRYDETLSTLQAFLGSPFVTEFRRFTQPTQAYYDYEDYRAWACADIYPETSRPAGAPARVVRSPEVSIEPLPLGLGIRLSF